MHPMWRLSSLKGTSSHFQSLEDPGLAELSQKVIYKKVLPGELLPFFRLQAVPFSGDLSQRAVGPKCHTRRCVLQIHGRTINFLFPGYCDNNCAARSIQSQ